MILRGMAKRYRWALVLVVVLLMAGIARSALGYLPDLAGHWSGPMIAALEAKGIIKGNPSGQFGPEGSMTRAEMAKLLVTGLGYEGEAELLSRYDSRFSDIPRSHWAKGYIESLAETAVTEGYPDNRFGPDDTVTRAQMAVFLVRAAGLSSQARAARFNATHYRDDRTIPEWARGSVSVALATGLMSGFEDQTFRPQQPITRAEGGATLLRLLSLKGSAYHLTGTLLSFDPRTRDGLVRDVLGQEQPITLAWNVQVYHGGEPSSFTRLQPLDQVWVILDPDGLVSFVEARITEAVGTNLTVSDQSITFTLPNGNQRKHAVEPGAVIFLNGRMATLAQVDGAAELYVVLNSETAEVRVLDAVNAPHRGELIDVDSLGGMIAIALPDDEFQPIPVDPEAVLLLNGERTDLFGLEPGDQVQFALDDDGLVVYLQAER